MSSKTPHVDSFISAVRSRLNSHRFLNSLLWSATLGAAALVAIGLSYVVRGYAVPPLWYGVVGGISSVVAVGVWLATRTDGDRAARFADEYFSLQDAVVSCSHFAQTGKEGGFYDLQAGQTEGRVATLAPTAIKYRVPRGPIVGLLIFGIAAIVLGLQEPSEAVGQRIAREQQTLEQTEQINEEFEKLIDQLEEEIKGSDEEELIDPSQLRKWVDELKATTDRKEALRQYARLEKKLQDAASRLEQKRDEKLLERAAKELDKDRETKELAKQLEQKKYQDAAKQLKGLRSKRDKLDEQRKELARLKSAANRMSTAARSLKKQQDGRQLDRLSRDKPSPADLQSQQTLQDGGDLEDAIADLEDAVEEWDGALTDAELEEIELGECEEVTLEKCKLCRGGVNDELDKLGKKLYRLGLMRDAQKKLAKLCRACSQCQSGMCRSPNAGGKKAGWGTNPNTRDERDELTDNGQYTQLKGIKGQGPSLTKVEAAEDGSGVSTRRHEARARTFQRQVESFVQREDVPENVKSGVKEYFKNIHEVDEPTESVGTE